MYPFPKRDISKRGRKPGKKNFGSKKIGKEQLLQHMYNAIEKISYKSIKKPIKKEVQTELDWYEIFKEVGGYNSEYLKLYSKSAYSHISVWDHIDVRLDIFDLLIKCDWDPLIAQYFLERNTEEPVAEIGWWFDNYDREKKSVFTPEIIQQIQKPSTSIYFGIIDKILGKKAEILVNIFKYSLF